MQRLALLVVTAGLGLAVSAARAATPIDFNRDVRPILSENCFACHGFDEKAREAELRLDVAESAYADRSGSRALVPGKLGESEAWRRIMSDDPDEVMPPPKSKLTLTADEKATLKRWIEEGAKYAKHWSFIPPVQADIPKVSQPNWCRNEIDYFVMAKLDAEGFKPSPEADPGMLVRRISLDLTGLPPEAEEVERFAKAYSRTPSPPHSRTSGTGVREHGGAGENTYEAHIDRFLASPHFGERMALDWLDAARYADTNGFSIDGGRHIWLWRDWVIQAFNDNLPYDRFLVEQLAGDLLPQATQAQLIATGFQRNNMVTHEGGTIPEENLTNYNVDRVKTLGEAVLGLTLGCAQCHDHKYDPITQRDYYRLFAYFNTASDIGLDGNGGVNPRPFLQARTVLKAEDPKKIEAELVALREKLANPDAVAVAAWEQEQRKQLAERGQGLRLLPTEPLKVSTPNRGAGFEVEGQQVLITQASDLAAYDVSLKLPQTDAPITGFRVVFHPDEKTPGGGLGYGPAEKQPRKAAAGKPARDKAPPRDKAPTAEPDSDFKGNFVLTAFSASADVVPGDQVNLHRLLPVRGVTANTWQAQYPAEDCLDPRNHNGWSPELEHEGPAHLTVTFAEPLIAKDTPYATVQVNFGHGKSLVAARFEILAMTGRDDGSPLPAEMIAIVQTDAANRTSEQQAKLRDYFAAHTDATRATRVDIANLEDRLAVLTREFPTMVMDTSEKPRVTRILRRGDYAQPGETVTAGTPAALPGLPEGAAANRLALAQWCVSRENPLTARVAVNRIWQMLFGAGLVRTSADFGAQGESPTHPELLDWLAVRFAKGSGGRGQESGVRETDTHDNLTPDPRRLTPTAPWDVKALVKLIVTSATYRQTSATSAALLERDPQNRLLARGPRFRLPAELIRDAALKTSGLLSPRLGGPSVNPYTPGDLWREISHYGSTPATAQAFVQDHGEKLYRRSLYTFWKRTAPPPNMAAFDAPNREVCTVARPNTTTPLQALVLLNDVQFVEAARAFAERMITHNGADVARLHWGFNECLSRPPTDREQKVLAAALARERERYKSHEAAARALLAAGESPRDEKIPVAEHAAWTQVATLLLNLSETVTRN